MATHLRIRIDENEIDKLGKLQPVKKIGTSNNATEVPKRAALGELGNNRTVLRSVKDGNKEILKDPKSQITLRAAKAKVDSNFNKKTVLGTKKVTRSNSIKTIPSIGVNGTSKPVLSQQTRPTAVTVKASNIENKVSHVKIVTKPKKEEKPEANNVAIRREDSNLSRRSLSKLRAALSRDKKDKTTGTQAVASTNSDAVANDKQQAIQVSNEDKILSFQSHSAKLIENIDADDVTNPILVSEYVNDIYSYLYHLEVEFPIEENFLKDQKEVTPKMRSVLIDWINEVHYQFHLVAETFQMSVSIIDRYLQTVKNTSRQHLQLVGVTALFIASKYEELYPPAIGDFVYITDDTYTKGQILAMEMKIMRTLGFNLSRPLPIHFLRRYSKAAKAEDNHHTMSKYFLELVSTEYSLSHYRPSEMAAASLLLSLRLLNVAPKMTDAQLWTPTLEYYSRYPVEHLRPLARKIAQIVRNAPNAKLKAIYQKYQSSKFDKISLKPQLSGHVIDEILKE